MGRFGATVFWILAAYAFMVPGIVWLAGEPSWYWGFASWFWGALFVWAGYILWSWD